MKKATILTLLTALSFGVTMAQMPSVSSLVVPVSVHLKPLYKLAEQAVDTIYTSEGYPEGWIQEECEIRYKYSFRRGPLSINAVGNKFQLSFLGYFKLEGAVRGCYKGKPITGWTPSCQCGFEEGEIPVKVQFNGQLSLLPTYQLKLDLQVQEPIPQGKCEVCFWKQDITPLVMKGIKKELLAAKKEIDKSYGLISFSKEFEAAWKEIQSPFAVSDLGYLLLQPLSFHVNQFEARNDSLVLLLGLNAAPVVTMEKDSSKPRPLPPIQASLNKPGFLINVETRLQYDSLSALLQRRLNGESFTLKKGFLQKKVIIDSLFLVDSYASHCMLKVYFSGSNNGIAYLRAKPWYDSIQHDIRLEEVDITLHANDKILDLADKLFQQKLQKELIARARFPLQEYLTLARNKLEMQLNREWVKGIQGKGSINQLTLHEIEAGPRYIKLTLQTKGELALTISEVSLSL